MHRNFNFGGVQFTLSFFCYLRFWCISKKPLQSPVSRRSPPVSFSELCSFASCSWVFGPLWSRFVDYVRHTCSFILLHGGYQVVPAHLLKSLCFLQWMVLAHCQKLFGPTREWFRALCCTPLFCVYLYFRVTLLWLLAFEARKSESSSFVTLFQASFGYLRVLRVHRNLGTDFSWMEHCKMRGH